MAVRPPRSERLQLPGPAGTIEALIETPEGVSTAAFGVICHPHPQYGGTLDNKVIYTLARAFHELAVPTIRFNFRGVGASVGQFADGIGETEDALAMIGHGRERWQGAELWLAGFSFGAVRAAAVAKPAVLVAVAPAIGRVAVDDVTFPSSRALVVQGDQDELVDAKEVLDWAARLAHPPQVALLPGVGHYFHGKLNELRETVTGFLKKQKPG
jgi:uncharacterized protein